MNLLSKMLVCHELLKLEVVLMKLIFERVYDEKIEYVVYGAGVAAVSSADHSGISES